MKITFENVDKNKKFNRDILCVYILFIFLGIPFDIGVKCVYYFFLQTFHV